MAPSPTKQRLFPGHLAFQELCVVTQRAWRNYEDFQKLRDDWTNSRCSLPRRHSWGCVTRSFPTAPLRMSAGEAIPAVTGLLRLFWSCQHSFCFRLSTLIIVTFLTSNQEPRSSSISGKIFKSRFSSLFSLKFFISLFFCNQFSA